MSVSRRELKEMRRKIKKAEAAKVKKPRRKKMLVAGAIISAVALGMLVFLYLPGEEFTLKLNYSVGDNTTVTTTITYHYDGTEVLTTTTTQNNEVISIENNNFLIRSTVTENENVTVTDFVIDVRGRIISSTTVSPPDNTDNEENLGDFEGQLQDIFSTLGLPERPVRLSRYLNVDEWSHTYDVPLIIYGQMFTFNFTDKNFVSSIETVSVGAGQFNCFVITTAMQGNVDYDGSTVLTLKGTSKTYMDRGTGYNVKSSSTADIEYFIGFEKIKMTVVSVTELTNASLA